MRKVTVEKNGKGEKVTTVEETLTDPSAGRDTGFVYNYDLKTKP